MTPTFFRPQRLIPTALLALAALGTPASWALGSYDGIYQSSLESNNYLAVHQSGNTLIVASFNTIGPVGAVQSTAAGMYTPARQDIWDLYQGTLSGSLGSLSGQLLYGACQANVSANFDSTGVQLTLNSLSSTSSGQNQGISCGLLPARTATNVRFTKIY